MPDIEREQQLLKVDPAFQEYFRKSSHRCSQSGGSTIRSLSPPGAEAYR